MHPDVFTKFHEVRHRSGHVVASRGNVRAGSRVWIDDSAVSVGDQTEVSGLVVDVLADDPKAPDRGSPTLFAGSDRRDESDPPVLDQTSGLLGKVNDHLGLLSTYFGT